MGLELPKTNLIIQVEMGVEEGGAGITLEAACGGKSPGQMPAAWSFSPTPATSDLRQLGQGPGPLAVSCR